MVAPRVKFTGRKPLYKKELGLAFGTYVECYDPACESRSIDSERSEPCIALYPTGNANGSWWFLNLKTKRRVRRTNWQIMVTTDLIINTMNEYANENVGQQDSSEVLLFEEDELHEETDDVAVDEVDGVVEPIHMESNTFEHCVDGTVETNSSNQSETIEDTESMDVGETPAVISPPLPTTHRPQERRSCRIAGGVRKPAKYQSYHTSVKKGLRDHGAHAYKAVVAELKQLLCDKKAMHPVHRGDLSARQLKTVIRSLMFLKTKFDGLGRFEKIKARLVANGAQQDRKLYPDTSSPTAMLQSVMMCVLIAAKENRKAVAIDIGGAYLNAERSGEDVIMELEPLLAKILAKIAPEVKPFIDEKGRMLVMVDKALYGCLDSAKLWYDTLTAKLRDMGFVHNPVDPCVMNKMINGKQCTLVIYVDDILATCVDAEVINEVVSELTREYGDVKACQDKDISYLGMHIRIENGTATISMKAYLEDVLKEHGIAGVVNTPATADLFKINGAACALGKREAAEFHTVVAKLLYLAKRARPDILLAIAFLCTCLKCPTVQERGKLDRLLKYLGGTAAQVLVLKPTDDPLVKGYIDASFGCHRDGKSHSGLVVTVFGAVVLCMSSKQKIVTKDSTEAELVALSDKVMNVVQCNDFMRGQGQELGAPVIMQDNTSTITLVTKGGGQYRTKYMLVRQSFVKERVDCGDVAVTHCATLKMLADALTKPL